MIKTIIFLLLVILMSACTAEKNSGGKQTEPLATDLVQTDIPKQPSEVGAPLPAGQDIVNLFFNLIDEKRISEAVDMLSVIAAPDDSSRQAWGVQFDAIESISVIDIEPWEAENWTDRKQIYKATLEAYVENDPSAPIPYYGWGDNPNIRWVTLEKDEENLWKVASIATGP